MPVRLESRSGRPGRRALAYAAFTLLAGCAPAGSEAPILATVPAAVNVAPSPVRTPPLFAAELGLSTRERAEWRSEVRSLVAPCPGATTLATCLEEPDSCGLCEPAAAFLAKRTRLGQSKSERESAYRARFISAPMAVPEGGVSVGTREAPVTLVVWEDLECPFCKRVAPTVAELPARFPRDVRVVFRSYPIPHHPHALAAARALAAADRQGAFTRMRAQLFDHQERLTAADLRGYAKELGLDLRRFDRDLVSPEVAAAVDDDVLAGDRIGLDGTPFVLVAGRRLEFLSADEFVDGLEESLSIERVRARAGAVK